MGEQSCLDNFHQEKKQLHVMGLQNKHKHWIENFAPAHAMSEQNI